MEIGTMQGLFRLLLRAFEDLGAPIPNDRLEKIAVMVYSAMSNPARNYHNLDHVFNFLNPPDPIRYLAAVFHDVVYYQVDDGILPEFEKDLVPYVTQKNGAFTINDPIPTNEKRFLWLLEIFGYKPGQEIRLNEGLNEFLSALVTVKSLGGLIQEHDLFQIVVCIEATIPFRGPERDGRGHFEILAEKLYRLRTRLPFLGTPAEIDTALHRAVIFSNQDVETFKMADPGRFLVITFKLLPESNVALRKRGVFSIRDYRIGLQNMSHFLHTLNPANVFNRYKNVPTAEEFEVMSQQAGKNIQIAQRYLLIKLLAMAILEGLAEATGGDAPLSLFMGDLPKPGVDIERMEDYLPDIPTPDFVDKQSVLLRLFSVGLSELGFDLPYSPTSLFLYKTLDDGEQDRLYASAEAFFSGELSADAFLEKVPQRTLAPIAKAIAALVITRREKLLNYAQA